MLSQIRSCSKSYKDFLPHLAVGAEAVGGGGWGRGVRGWEDGSRARWGTGRGTGELVGGVKLLPLAYKAYLFHL